MKISHSIIVLTSIIFVTGSMLTVGMDLKRKTDNVYTNVAKARHMHSQYQDTYVGQIKKDEEKVNAGSNKEMNLLEKDQMQQAKVSYKTKLESLNKQNNKGVSNKFSLKRIENRTSLD